MHLQQRVQRGFTLAEMIVVMVITGIIGGMVAMFIKAPVQGYVDSSRRAEMTDIADTALRRLARDIRTAVPNSVRLPTPAGSTYIEFLPTKDGGRYRADPSGGAGNLCNGVPGNTTGDALNFDNPDSCFEIVGSTITFAAGDQIVIGSTQSDGASAYADCALTPLTCIRRPIPAAGANQQVVKMTSNTALPAFAELLSQRFDVVDGAQQAVTYACVGALGTLDANNDGQAHLMRYWGYGFKPGQLPPPAAVGAATAGSIGAVAHSEAVLADKISACNIVYDLVNQRNGLISITLDVTRGGESIRLYHAIHVNNVP